MKRPKVLVGCPTSEHKTYCLDAYLEAATSLIYPNYDLLLVDNSKNNSYFALLKKKKVNVVKAPYFATARERIVHSRNILRKKVLGGDYEYFLSLEQDVIPPKDIIERLLQHGKKVITGVYFVEYDVKKDGQIVGKKTLPLLYKKKDKEHVEQLQEQAVAGDHLLQVAASGLGCVLIHRGVLKKIAFRFAEDKLVFDDIWFCQDLEKAGYPLFVDTSVKCKHLLREMDWSSIEK